MYLAQGITEEQYRAADLAMRERDFALRERQLLQQKSSDVWNVIGTIATIAVPLLTILGLETYFRIGRSKKR